MRKHIFGLVLLTLLVWNPISGQGNSPQPDRLKVFVDCSNTWCDMDYLRTEINLVDFFLDRQAADVHVLITAQETGGGGNQFQIIFFGQHQFRQRSDTLRFNLEPNSTHFARRELMAKYVKIGLTPFIAKTKAGKDIRIQMKKDPNDKGSKGKPDTSTSTKDPWNYWVFNLGMNGHMNADAVYRESRLSGNLSVNRVTDDWKIGFEVWGGRNKTSYTVNDSGTIRKIVNRNNDYTFEHFLIKSITDHWSFGYETIFSRNTFSNNKSRAFFHTGIEYAIFPYKLANSKYFTVSYTADVRHNRYFDTTLYLKTQETLWGHGVESNLTFNQKWGTMQFGLEYHNYLHNWKYFNLRSDFEVDIKITGGLSFNIFGFGALTRDQLFLPKEGAELEEVLTRRRQIASGYNFGAFFGVNYRFGSKLNNFVNRRFD